MSDGTEEKPVGEIRIPDDWSEEQKADAMDALRSAMKAGEQGHAVRWEHPIESGLTSPLQVQPGTKTTRVVVQGVEWEWQPDMASWTNDKGEVWGQTYDIVETALVEAQIRTAGCDPQDPDSHDWERKGENHTTDGRTVWYRCRKCGVEDSS